jgi:uncharacterized protein (DUF736 family)
VESPTALTPGSRRQRACHVLLNPSLSNQPLQNGLFNGLIWPKVGCASIAYAAMAPIDFLPLPAAPSFLAKQQSRLAAILRCTAVASDAASIAFGLPIAIEAAMVRARNRVQGELSWRPSAPSRRPATTNSSAIVTLSVQAKNVRIVPESSRSAENAPSHRVFVGRAEIGAAWSKRSGEGRDYLSVKLDDPSFNAPIYANLFDEEGGESYTLIWSRGRKVNAD